MKKPRNFLYVILGILLLVASVPAFAMAQVGGAPCWPNSFYGSAIVNGNPAPTGMKVTAKINNVEVGNTTSVNGKYGFYPFVLYVNDNDNNCENAATVQFFIEGQPAGQSTFQNGVFTNLDLSAIGVVYCGDGTCSGSESCSTCSQDCGTCSSGGNGGGTGGSSGGDGGTGNSGSQACTPSWQCSSWSQCVDGAQTRQCIDSNNCGTQEGKPAVQQLCGIESVLPSACTEGQTMCVGNDLYACGGGSWQKSQTCQYGCSGSACLGKPAEAAAPNALGGAPLLGFLFEAAAWPYWIIIIGIFVIPVLWYLPGRTKKK
jgi:hypothetical protein